MADRSHWYNTHAINLRLAGLLSPPAKTQSSQAPAELSNVMLNLFIFDFPFVDCFWPSLTSHLEKSFLAVHWSLCYQPRGFAGNPPAVDKALLVRLNSAGPMRADSPHSFRIDHITSCRGARRVWIRAIACVVKFVLLFTCLGLQSRTSLEHKSHRQQGPWSVALAWLAFRELKLWL